MLLQLHRRLYHTSAEQMTPVPRRAGIPLATLSLAKTAVDHCEICLRCAKVPTQPSVATRLAVAFNQAACGDIWLLGDMMFLFSLDDATRFSKFWYVARKITLKEQLGEAGLQSSVPPLPWRRTKNEHWPGSSISR